MAYLVEQFAKVNQRKCFKMSTTTDFKQYFSEHPNYIIRTRIPETPKYPNYTWVSPRPNEGPAPQSLCGLRPGLRCASSRRQSKFQFDMSYYPIYYSRDVILQSPRHKTTQERFAEYISKHPVDLCVVNAGLHDMNIPTLTGTTHAANVVQYLSLLTGCSYIIWLQTSSTRGDLEYPQKNDKIQRWNSKVANQIHWHEALHSRVSICDVFDFSKHFPRLDNAHFTDEYYVQLASKLPALI